MRLRLRATALAAMLLCAMAVTLSTAGPAAAATPQCTQAAAHYPSSGAGPLYVPAATNGNRLCWMQSGNYSSAVRALQFALRDCYGQNIAVDSSFGPATAGALRNVQGYVGAKVDGKYGPETARAMKMSATWSTDPANCAWQSF
ncbi:peptidoglycan-binding domain-containing protein [Phytomonospora sp. NPDC050363]|uniref:peptidoglycan-binding domain-containing protein n=1 Tax=Phytomonospora sp. NPDC050363 TaxID=3155642 RepID=UPI0033C5D803